MVDLPLPDLPHTPRRSPGLSEKLTLRNDIGPSSPLYPTVTSSKRTSTAGTASASILAKAVLGISFSLPASSLDLRSLDHLFDPFQTDDSDL